MLTVKHPDISALQNVITFTRENSILKGVVTPNPTSPGADYFWTVPIGVKKILISIVGAGAGGGGGHATGGGGGGGGAGEGTVDYPLIVVENTDIVLRVGAGGAGGAVGLNGANGTISYVVRDNDNLSTDTPPRMNTNKGGWGGTAGQPINGGRGGDSAPTTTVNGIVPGGVGGTAGVNGSMGSNSVQLGFLNSGAAGGGGGSTTSTGGRGGFSQFVSSSPGAGNSSGGGGASSLLGLGGSGGVINTAGVTPGISQPNFGSGGGGGGQNAAGGNGSNGVVTITY